MKNEVHVTAEAESLLRYISKYEEGGETYYQIYINLRSKKLPSVIREQRRVHGLGTLREAVRLRDKYVVELAKAIERREAEGLTWGEIVEKWEMYWRRYPSRTFNDATLSDHVARMTNWTECWWKKPVSEVSIGDVRDVIKNAFDAGASLSLRKAIKQTINQIFKWGLEEKLIQKMDRSPARDIEILCVGEARPDEKRKEILTALQIAKHLEVAERNEHPWYPVWFVGFHSGMRTSELEALRKERVELVPREVARALDLLPDGDARKNYGFLHVEWAWKNKVRVDPKNGEPVKGFYGPTKAHYARSVPINSELYYFLIDYLPKANFGKDEIGERVFPGLQGWRRGDQARVIRLFCEASGLPSIKFHTIRACFATQLLGLGVPEDKVMKMGGWKDVETMRIYVRLAGIVEQGATQGLQFKDGGRKFDPQSPYRNVAYQKGTELSDDSEDEEDSDETEAVAAGREAQAAKSVSPEANAQVRGPEAAPAVVAGKVVSLANFRKERARSVE